MPGSAAELRRQILAVAVAGLGLGFQAVELGVEHRALEFAQAVVAGHDVVLVPKPAGDAPAVVDRAAGLGQRVVGRGDDAAFAAGEVLAGLEGERTQVADGAGGPLPVKRAVGVGGIFDHHQVVRSGDGHDGVHVRGLAGQVDRDDGARARRDGGFDGLRDRG